ncbi:MAG: enoyl-CoA hydratase [Gammaproteobacteria bacterium]|nr:enoyl-CoA hydratase [Gammaproteobacteria bacterium]
MQGEMLELKSTEFEVDEEGIATIWLSRPKRMNAWTGRMHTEYRYLLSRAEQDQGVRGIVVTGRGKGFCVGGDSDALTGHIKKGGYDSGTSDEIEWPGYGVSDDFDALFAYHYGLSKPIVAAINGPVAGVGLALACFVDIRFAAPGIKLTTAHGKLNLPAEYGLSWVLPRLVGLGRANDLLLTSRVFYSEEALTMGLVNQLFDSVNIVQQARGYLHEMVRAVSPNSIKQTRWQIYKDLHRDAASSVEDSEKLLKEMMKEQDYQEGVQAFLDKRNPKWSSFN